MAVSFFHSFKLCLSSDIANVWVCDVFFLDSFVCLFGSLSQYYSLINDNYFYVLLTFFFFISVVYLLRSYYWYRIFVLYNADARFMSNTLILFRSINKKNSCFFVVALLLCNSRVLGIVRCLLFRAFLFVWI